jgi:hypothetical protein
MGFLNLYVGFLVQKVVRTDAKVVKITSYMGRKVSVARACHGARITVR